MAQLGDVILSAVYSEKPVRSVKTTDHPVEDGASITDHIEKQPYRLEITGVVTGPDAAVRLKRLEFYMDNGVTVTYVCRNWVGGVIIESFNSVHDTTNKGAFNFTMSLKKIRTATAAEAEGLTLPAQVQTKKVGNKGLQQAQTPAQMAAANDNHVNAKFKK